MTVIDPPTDAKAGYSADCRANRHTFCAITQARCTCSCHGPHGQHPPTPKEAAMSDATVTPLPSKPVAVDEYECDECDRTFVTEHARRIHVARGHKTERPEPKPKTRRTPKAKTEPRKVEPPKPADDRQLLAIVAQAYHDLNGADIATCIDSAATILDAISNADWRIVEAS